MHREPHPSVDQKRYHLMHIKTNAIYILKKGKYHSSWIVLLQIFSEIAWANSIKPLFD